VSSVRGPMPKRRRRSTVAAVAADAVQTRDQADEIRRLLPLAALAFAVVAALTDPSSAVNVALAATPAAAFAAWAYRPAVPLVALALGVIAPVVVAQRSGALEPLMFEASLLGFVAGRWGASRAQAVVLGGVASATPVLVAVVQDPAQVSVGMWILGIALPWVLGVGSARQAALARELDATRRELAQQALLQERRRIARDVHDFVGHGLAAMMLQVTSARHVLRRDPNAAEEALRSAEEVGRRSMQELRRTVALLRADDETGVDAPVPSAADIPALVDDACAGGLAVELRTRGDLSRVGGGVGVATYRIAQEALANAARHAPRARTVLAVELADGHVALTAETRGPLAPAAPDPDRPRYGLIGMRERAAALGGELDAGRTPAGWRVRCRLPLAEEP
jgi:signal transduction histidine kinase